MFITTCCTWVHPKNNHNHIISKTGKCTHIHIFYFHLFLERQTRECNKPISIFITRERRLKNTTENWWQWWSAQLCLHAAICFTFFSRFSKIYLKCVRIISYLNWIDISAIHLHTSTLHCIRIRWRLCPTAKHESIYIKKYPYRKVQIVNIFCLLLQYRFHLITLLFLNAKKHFFCFWSLLVSIPRWTI